jgi:hypothetical protein
MNENNATEANAQPIAPVEDPETKIARLEAEKVKLAEEKENYRKAYLKADGGSSSDTDEERLRKIARDELASSRLVEIAREQDEIIRQTLKENKELKQAHLAKNNPPAVMGSHSESTPVTDTLITPEQMAFFKQKGWSDKDIERYKKSLSARR